MYLNFNVLNNEVFAGCDDTWIEAWKGDNGWEFKDSDVTTDRVN